MSPFDLLEIADSLFPRLVRVTLIVLFLAFPAIAAMVFIWAVRVTAHEITSQDLRPIVAHAIHELRACHPPHGTCQPATAP